MKRILAILLLAVTVFFAGCQKNSRVYNGKEVIVDTTSKILLHGEDMYSYTFWDNGMTMETKITYPNAKTMTVVEDRISGEKTSHGTLTEAEKEKYLSEWTILELINENSKERPKFRIGFFLFGLVLAGTGLFQSIRPEEWIYLTYWRWFEDPEPTERMTYRTRIGGIITVIAGIICIITAFTK